MEFLFIFLAILALVLFFYVMIKNIARGAFKSFTQRRTTEYAYKEAPGGNPWHEYIPIMDMNMEWFKTVLSDVYIDSFDGFKLHGYYAKADSQKTMIYFHGYSSNGLKEGSTFAKIYYEMGYNVLVVEQRGHDLSEGDYITFGVLEARDVSSWVSYVNNISSGEIVIHGTSMGAATVLGALKYNLPNVSLIVADSGFGCAYDALFEGFSFNKPLRKMLMHFIYRDYLKYAKADLKADSPRELVGKSSIPILFVVGSDDTQTPPVLSKELSDLCVSKHELLIIDGAIHASSIYTNQDKYIEAIKHFLG